MTTHASEAEARRWLKNLAAQGQVVEIEQLPPRPKRARKAREPKEPKPPKPAILERVGAFGSTGKIHRWVWHDAWGLWNSACGNATNLEPQDREGEECPRCFNTKGE